MKHNIDPELVEFVEALPGLELNKLDIKEARAAEREMLKAMNAQTDVSALEIVDRMIPGPEGAPHVPIRIYTPKGRNGLIPGLLSIHGGAFILGDIDTDHILSATLATQLDIAIISVDYRLAPESHFPAPLEDCYAALVWMQSNASEFGIDIDRIGVFGVSAGGNLAAGLALLARDRGGPNLCFQFLGLPALDDRLGTTSMRTFVDTPMVNRSDMEMAWKYYLGEGIKHGSKDISPYATPARATDLSGLPSTYIAVMEFDPLRDEGIIYALRLLEAGVQVELHAFPGTFHGSSLVTTAKVSQRQEAEMIDVLHRGLRI